MSSNPDERPMTSPATAPPGPRGVDPRPARGGRGLSYRLKLALGVCGLILLTGVTITWVAHRGARASTEALVDALFREVSGHAVTHTRGFVLRAAPLVESLRLLGEDGLALDDSDRLATQLLAFLEGNPGLSWVSYSDEAGTFTGVQRTPGGGLRVNQSRIVGGRTRLVEHDVRPDGSWAVSRRVEDSGYDPRTRDFYRRARRSGRLVWQPLYMFYNQGVPGISCAGPVRDDGGRFRGVISVDFDLIALSDFVAGLSVSEHSKIFLFRRDGTLLAHPDLRGIAAAARPEADDIPTLADTGDPLVDAYRRHLRPEHVRPGTGERFHRFAFRRDGTGYLASATTFRIGGELDWVVGAVAPEDDFLLGVRRGRRQAFAVAAGALLVAVLLAAVLARRVSGPVEALVGFMNRVGAGDLDARADFAGSREFRRLSAALNRMIADLRDRLRLRHSLTVAMEVQQRLLPRRPPRVRGLDLAGHSTYCDETGGDYYDFLALDPLGPDRVLVAVGDVMGHGVASALVMAGIRAVLRDRADTAGSLAELMGRLNRMLASDHEGDRFMTMHLAVVDARTGSYRWASAGHDPALIYDPTTDRFEESEAGGVALGILDDAGYEEHTCGPLRPGQVLVVGTDGVWEMPNAADEQYGKARLREVIRAAAPGTAEAISRAIRESLCAFRGDCRPADDVTFVVLKVVHGDAEGAAHTARAGDEPRGDPVTPPGDPTPAGVA